MTNAPMDAVLQHLRDLSGSGSVELSDGQLLECFVRHRDATAFDLLLRRHGPMVHGVCRRILRDAQEAEDAFQATFLVLVRRAADLHRMGSLAGWLHGVAYRVATRARSRAQRRPACDTEAMEMTPARPEPERPDSDLRPILDEELARLPEKYRLPLVLCYLEGRTHEEAAQALGWPKGTVAGRLARARERLRSRLTRRGLAASASVVVAVLVEQNASAVPPSLTAATTHLVLASTLSGAAGATSSLAITLAEEVLAGAARSKFQMIVAGLLTAAGLAVGAGVLAMSRMPGNPTVPPQAGAPHHEDDPADKMHHPRLAFRPDLHDDPLPSVARMRLGTIRYRKGLLHDRIGILSGGKLIATASPGGGLSLWDLASGRPRYASHHTGERVASISASPDGKVLAVAGVRGTIGLRDLFAEREPDRLDGPPRVLVVFSPDGSTLAAAKAPPRNDGHIAADFTICLYDVPGRKLRSELRGHSAQVLDVAFTGDGKSLVTAGDDGTLRVWDAVTAEQKLRLDNPGGALRCVAADPTGSGRVVSGDRSGTLRLWDIPRTQPLRHMAAHQGAVGSVAFAPDGRTVVSHGVQGGDVEVWDVATGEPLRSLPTPESSGGSLGFGLDGKAIVLGATMIHVWDATTGQSLHSANGHQGEVHTLAFSPDGKVLASGADDRSIRLWNLTTGRELHTLEGHDAGVRGLAFAPDGKILASSSSDSTLRLWSAAEGKELRHFDPAQGTPESLAFSADGQSLRGHNPRGEVTRWQLPQGDLLSRFLAPVPNSQGGTLSRDGRLLALLCPERKVILWDLERNQELTTLIEPREAQFRTVAFSPDGKRLATAADEHVILWDLTTGKSIGSPEKREVVRSLAFSPDGRWLVLGGENGLVRWCDPSDAQELAWFPGHRGAILALAFSPDGSTLATGGADTTVLLWNRP